MDNNRDPVDGRGGMGDSGIGLDSREIANIDPPPPPATPPISSAQGTTPPISRIPHPYIPPLDSKSDPPLVVYHRKMRFG